MGIYSNGKIYGIRWNIFDENIIDIIKTYEKKDEVNQINYQMIYEIQMEYNQLSEDEKKKASFTYYTLCSSSYGKGTFMSWFPMNRDQLENLLNQGNHSLSSYILK